MCASREETQKAPSKIGSTGLLSPAQWDLRRDSSRPFSISAGRSRCSGDSTKHARYVLEGMDVARANPALAAMLGRIASESDRLGVTSDVDEIISQAPEGPWKDAALAELRGERTRAADMYRRMGAPAIEADVRIAAAEALLEEGRTAEGLAELEKALTFYRSVGATFFLDRGEALLAEAKTA